MIEFGDSPARGRQRDATRPKIRGCGPGQAPTSTASKRPAWAVYAAANGNKQVVRHRARPAQLLADFGGFEARDKMARLSRISRGG